MLVNRSLINKDIEKQIEIFYKLSNFLSKYLIVSLSLLLSVAFVFANISSSFPSIQSISYSSDILWFNKLWQTYIWKYDPSILNKKINYINFNYILSNTKLDKNYISIGNWLCYLKNWLQLPSFSKLPLKYLKAISTDSKNVKILVKKLNLYFKLIKLSNYNFKVTKIKLSKNKWISTKQMISDYNLNCINTVFNKTLFCNTNKYYLIHELETKPFDLSTQWYEKLFSNLSISDKYKCNIIKKIFSKKFNYDNIKEIAKKYCEDDNSFYTVKNMILNSKLSTLFTSTVPDWEDSKIYKFINQLSYITHLNNISSDLIATHIEYVKNLLKIWALSNEYLYLEYILLNNLKTKINSKIDNSSLSSSINELLNWNSTIKFKWITSYISNMIKNTNTTNTNDILIVNQWIVESKRERFIRVFKNIYKKYFILTKEINNQKDRNIYILIGKMILHSNVRWTTKKYKLPMEITINLNSFIWNKFKISKIKILDKWVLSYIKNKKIKIQTPINIINLSNYLSNVLTNYYINWWKFMELSLCDKAKKIWVWWVCNNNYISYQIKFNWEIFNIKFIFNWDTISNIEIPSNINFIINYWWAWKIEKKYNLKNLKTVLLKMIKNNTYWLYDTKRILNMVLKYLKKEKNKFKISKINLNPKEILHLHEVFKQYLWTNLIRIDYIKNNTYRLYYTLNWINFISNYDKVKNKLLSLAIYITKTKKTIKFKDINLILSDLDIERLNMFREDTKTFLKQLDSIAYENYKKSLKR